MIATPAEHNRHVAIATSNRIVDLVASADPKRIAQRLALLVLIIVVVGTVANIIIYNVAPSTEHALAKLMKRFDLGHEPSLPNWYSSIALLAASMLLAIIASAEKFAASKDTSRWYTLAAGFLLMAVDEAILIHEMADAPLHEWLDTGGLLYFAWVIPYFIVVLLLGAFFLPFLLRLSSRTRSLFVISGTLFVSGAIGVELFEGLIVDSQGVERGFASLKLTFAQTIEEALEMFAIVLFIYALLDYLQIHANRLTSASPADPLPLEDV